MHGSSHPTGRPHAARGLDRASRPRPRLTAFAPSATGPPTRAPSHPVSRLSALPRGFHAPLGASHARECSGGGTGAAVGWDWGSLVAGMVDGYGLTDKPRSIASAATARYVAKYPSAPPSESAARASGRELGCFCRMCVSGRGAASETESCVSRCAPPAKATSRGFRTRTCAPVTATAGGSFCGMRETNGGDRQLGDGRRRRLWNSHNASSCVRHRSRRPREWPGARPTRSGPCAAAANRMTWPRVGRRKLVWDYYSRAARTTSVAAVRLGR